MARTGFADITAESSALKANHQRRVSSNAFREMATPQLAASIASVAQNYPNVPGAIVVAGSLSGMSPESEQWKQIEVEEVKMREDRWANSGFAPIDYLLDVAQGTWGLTKATARGGMILFDALWEEGLPHKLRMGVTMYQNPELSFSSAWQQASVSTGWRAAGEFMGDPAGNIGTTMAHYLNLFLPFGDPFEATTESRVNLGAGFFANSQLVSADNFKVQQLQKQGYTEQEAIIAVSTDEFGSPSTQLWREGAESVRITGSNGVSTGVSLGRLGAMVVAEPGSTPYNWISGSIDFGSQIGLDPSNLLTGGIAKSRLAARGLDAAGAARKNHGLIDGIRRTVYQTDAAKAWGSSVGTGFAQAMTDTSDYYTIYQALKPNVRGRAPDHGLVQSLVSSNDIENTRRILIDASGSEIVRKPWNTGVIGGAVDALTGTRTGGQTLRGRAYGATSQFGGGIRRPSGLLTPPPPIASVTREVDMSRMLPRDSMTSRARNPLGLADYRMTKDSAVVTVTKEVERTTDNLMPHYGGYRPGLRQRMESNFLYEAGELRRVAGSRMGRKTSRLFAQMAGRSISIGSREAHAQGMGDIVDFARAVDATPEQMNRALEQWANLDPGNHGGALNVVEQLLDPYRQRLLDAGVRPEVVDKMTAVYKDTDEMTRYFVDGAGNIADPGVFTTLLANGDEIPVPLAHTLSEASMNAIPVPGRDGGRTLRRMTDYLTRAEGALDNGLKVPRSMFYDEEFNSRVLVRAGDGFMGLWRNMVLLRPAWTLRVVGEEQVRMAAEGVHVVNSPFKAMQLALTNENLKLGLQTRRKLLSSDLLGESLQYSDDYVSAMSRRGGSWFDTPGGYGAETWIRVAQDDKDFTKWWFREVNQLQSDEASSFIARAITDPDNPISLDDVKAAFRDGDLTHVREELAVMGSGPRHRALMTDEGADAYIDSLYARLHLKTGGRYETLRDDGWWYDDMGERLRPADDADLGTLRQAAEWGAQDTPGSKVRIKARTHAEYHDLLVRSGLDPDHVQNKMRKLERGTAGDERAFQALDPDARSVSIPADNLRDSDTLTDARVVQYKVTQTGNEELLRAIGDGQFRGINFDGSINALTEREMRKALGQMRDAGEVTAPAYVKGVEQTEKSNLYSRGIGVMYDTLMGKPTNRYSRSPAFFRAYWRAVEDMVDQGIVDERTAKAIQSILNEGVTSPIQASTRRAALESSERMGEQAKATEVLMARYEQEFGDLQGPAAAIVEGVRTRLSSIVDGEAYDISRFGRTMDQARREVGEVTAGLDEAIAAAKVDEAISAAERDELIRNLEGKRRELTKQLDSLESLADDALAEAENQMRRAMDEMSVDEYIEGLDPATSDAMSNRPTSMEDLVQRRIDELEQQGELTRREAFRRDVGPDGVEVGGSRPEILEGLPKGAGPRDSGVTRRLDEIEDWARELGIPVNWKNTKRRTEDGFEIFTVHIGEMPGVSTGRFRVDVHRSPEGPFTTETYEKVKGRWKRVRQADLDLWARRERQARRRTEVGERVEQLPAEAPRGPEWDQMAEGGIPDETFNELVYLTARERETAIRELGVTDQQLADARQIPAIKDAASGRLRRERLEAELFEEALATRPKQLYSIAEVDRMAKSTALTTVQDLLYDLSTKSAASDMLRLVFPFAEAWWEIISTWSRLIQGNPKVLQQFQKGYNALTEDVRPYDWTDADGNTHQGALPGAELQVEGYDDAGFFYVDPATQQEMFALPYLSQILSGNTAAGIGMGAVTGAALGGFFGGALGAGAIGAGIGAGLGAAAGGGVAQAGLVPEGESLDLSFSAQGLNMASQSPVPGLGPLAAVPVSWVLNLGGNAWQPLKEVLLPFGDYDTETPGSFIDDVMPPWFKRAAQAMNAGDAESLRIRANTTMEVAAMMVRQGEGSFNTQAQMRATLDEASRRAGWLYTIRSFAAATAPTGAGFEYSTQDFDGSWWATQTMANEWNRISEEMDGDPVATFDEFVGLYGLNPKTFMKGKTETVQRKSLTEKGYAFEKANDAMFKEFPQTAYYVSPDSPLDDTFEYDAYLESLREGTRVALSPEEWAMKSNQLAANISYERMRQSAEGFIAANGNTQPIMYQVNEQLYKFKEALRREYPGYGMQIAGSRSKLSLDQQLLEFERWTPAMKETPAGKGIDLYLKARQNAQDMSLQYGNSREWWKTSTDYRAVQMRQELKAIAAATYLKYPEFHPVYVGVFAQELSDG